MFGGGPASGRVAGGGSTGRASAASGGTATAEGWPGIDGAVARPAGRPMPGSVFGPEERSPGRAPSGARTVTATWIARPSRRDSASVIAGRSFDSITSRVNASGTATSAVSSTIARSHVRRR